MIEFLIAIIIGCLLGIITGITPGIHINLIAAILLVYSAILVKIADPIIIAVIIIAMSITHTFADFIPTTFLGAPNENTLSGTLPAHKLLLKGEGEKAIRLSIMGSITGIILTIIFSPALFFIIKILFEKIQPSFGVLLVLISISLVIKEEKKLKAAGLLLISGCLGIVVLNSPVLKDPLLPLFTGLFGISSLVISINDNTKIPKQKTKSEINIKIKEILGISILSTFLSSLTAILPAITTSQITNIIMSIYKKLKEEIVILITSLIGTSSMIMSLIGLYAIGKARNGSIISIKEIIGKMDLQIILIIYSTILITIGVSYLLTIQTSKIFINVIQKINYKIISVTLTLLLIILIFYFTGYTGILVAITSTSLGVLTIKSNIGRNVLISCLIMPVALFYIL